MWIPQINSIKRVNNQLKINVGFLNDADNSSTDEDYTINKPDLESLKSQIKNRVDVLNAQDSFNLPLGTIDTTPIIVPPTQAEIDQKQFIEDYQLWLKVKHGIDVGVLTGNETAVVNLKAKVQAEFKPSYLNLL